MNVSKKDGDGESTWEVFLSRGQGTKNWIRLQRERESSSVTAATFSASPPVSTSAHHSLLRIRSAETHCKRWLGRVGWGGISQFPPVYTTLNKKWIKGHSVYPHITLKPCDTAAWWNISLCRRGAWITAEKEQINVIKPLVSVNWISKHADTCEMTSLALILTISHCVSTQRCTDIKTDLPNTSELWTFACADI